MPSDISPTARALRTLEILQTRPGTTADELAARLGVTERAARRYVEILREADIPVSSTRGPHGGYRLGRGTRLPPVTFTQTEALGLVMAVLDSRPDADGLVSTALGKVIRALPEDVGRQAATLREHASAAPDRYAARPDTAVTSELVAAVAARRRVAVTYRGESGSEWVAEVDPWAVVVRYGRWYLLCHSHRADAVRTYRVDRVLAVEHTDVGFEPPADLDPVAALEEHLGTGWRFTTRVVFHAPLADVAPWIRPEMGRLEAVGPEVVGPEAVGPGASGREAAGVVAVDLETPGLEAPGLEAPGLEASGLEASGLEASVPESSGAACVLVGSTRNPAMYAQEWLASVPFPFHVEGGPELREAVGVLAKRLAAAVGQP